MCLSKVRREVMAYRARRRLSERLKPFRRSSTKIWRRFRSTPHLTPGMRFGRKNTAIRRSHPLRPLISNRALRFFRGKVGQRFHSGTSIARCCMKQGTWSEALWSDPANKQDWRDAIASDGQAPSEYARNNMTEDFAESANMYWSSKGTACEAEGRKRYRARYEYFDRIAK
ncbi:MAG: Rhs element Vgr family protein [Caballeronia sp.]|nr:Rhs element Vgr family protein [Caballeronia sp.]